MKIRTALPGDAEAIERLYCELETDAVAYQPQHFVMSPAGSRAAQLKDILDSEGQTMLVAEDGGKVIGFAHAVIYKAKDISCLKPQKCVYLQDLVVTENCRSRGTGTVLMDAVKQYGRENGAEFFRTQVFPANEDGLRFYIRNGFTETMKTIECPL